MQIKSIFLQHW